MGARIAPRRGARGGAAPGGGPPGIPRLDCSFWCPTSTRCSSRCPPMPRRPSARRPSRGSRSSIDPLGAVTRGATGFICFRSQPAVGAHEVICRRAPARHLARRALRGAALRRGGRRLACSGCRAHPDASCVHLIVNGVGRGDGLSAAIAVKALAAPSSTTSAGPATFATEEAAAPPAARGGRRRHLPSLPWASRSAVQASDHPPAAGAAVRGGGGARRRDPLPTALRALTGALLAPCRNSTSGSAPSRGEPQEFCWGSSTSSRCRRSWLDF